MVGPTRPVFVLFGSSVVEFSFSNGGWGSILAETYARWTSRQALKVLSTIFPHDAPIQPSLVIIYFGGNDSTGPHPSGFGAHVPLQEYIENMRKIGLHIRSLSEMTRVIFLSAPPINERMRLELTCPSPYNMDRTNKFLKDYSEACIKMCNEMNFTVVDMFYVIQTKDDWADVFFTDGVHLSAEGSKRVAKAILNTINEANWKPSLHREDMPVEFEDISS
ncbi:hypothetical protein LUZ60_015376 [Juncus effusus]|nr:hypothetical protein LUZ60_015376 [Juncus effusus]